jgi:hypothetical protein
VRLPIDHIPCCAQADSHLLRDLRVAQTLAAKLLRNPISFAVIGLWSIWAADAPNLKTDFKMTSVRNMPPWGFEPQSPP